MLSEKIGGWKKIITGFAVFGFIVSLVNGILGRVLFHIILLRAFLFAVVFAGIGLLIMLLIEKFIPELLSAAEDEDDSENQDLSDIMEEDGENENAVSGRNFDITIEDDAEPVQEVEELNSVEDNDMGNIVEQPVFVQDENSVEQKPVSEPVQTSDSSDEEGALPDIGTFADSFATQNIPDSGEGLSSIDQISGQGKAEILGGMHDTQEIVKAVKTVLKKDQEG